MTPDRVLRWNELRSNWIRFLEGTCSRYEAESDDGSVVKCRRQIEALHGLSYGLACSPALVRWLIDPTAECGSPAIASWVGEVHFVQVMNEAQKNAVRACLAAPHVALVQGPPGTGKTTVITEVCLQLLLRGGGERILICSETHVAVDNVLERLLDRLENLRALRVATNEDRISQDPRIRGITTEATLKRYRERLPALGVEGELIDTIDGVFAASPRETTRALMRSCDVVGATCNGLAAFPWDSTEDAFDVVILDEVCKATFPEVVIPLLRARKAILVGDPRQLPPTFCREDRETAAELELEELLAQGHVEELFQIAPPAHKAFLDLQYRMTNEIGELVSRLFYGGTLRNGLDRPSPNSAQWIDYTATRKFPIKEGGPIFNHDEADLIVRLLQEEHVRVEAAGTVEATTLDVAVITPYRPQMKLLRERLARVHLPRFNTMVDTIDSFQGKDADYVVFSVTRTCGSHRFFADPRRLNVALSRAKHRLWLVGNSRFLKRAPLFHDLDTVLPRRGDRS